MIAHSSGQSVLQGRGWATTQLIATLTSLLFSAAATALSSSAATTDDPVFRFGNFAGQIDGLNDPSAAAIDEDGTIYIADTLHRRVLIADRTGVVKQTLGQGVLHMPAGIALDPSRDESVFVTDSAAGRVLRFYTNSTEHDVLVERGSTAMRAPHGITATAERVYIADPRTDKVYIFDHQGNVLQSIGSHGAAPGQFNRIKDVAVADGFLYVADAENHRVQKFDANGEFVKAWGQWGPFPGLFNRPSGIAVQGQRVFVVDQQNHRLQVFTLDGQRRYQWGLHALLPREGEGKLHYPADIAIDPAGRFCVIVEPFENRAQIFDVAPDDVPESQVATPIQPVIEQTHFGQYLHLDQNVLAIGEPETHRVYIFRIDTEIPVSVTQFGMQGRQFGRFDHVGPVHVDAQSKHVWVIDRATRRVQQFALDVDLDGAPRMQPYVDRLLRVFDVPHMLKFNSMLNDDAGVFDPIAMTLDGATLYLLDAASQRVFALDTDSRAMNWIDVSPESASPLEEGAHLRFARLVDMKLGAGERQLHVLDAGRLRIEVFDIDSRSHVRSIDLASIVGGGEPIALALDGAGGYLISDRGRSIVHHVGRHGETRIVGAMGSEGGQFWKPGGLAVDVNGRLFITDFGNHRAQIFDRRGEWMVTFGIGRAQTPRDRRSRDES